MKRNGSDTANSPESRAQAWAGTMRGRFEGALCFAHADDHFALPGFTPLSLSDRQRDPCGEASSAATIVLGAGNRDREEAPDAVRTCFERDRDRIVHSNAFRRLAGKTQVFIFPDDHQRTRLTHALEVAQVAVAIARNLRLNIALAEAIALGHDCGHGAGGHASEDALSPYLPDGFDHATWGADVVLQPLNLCAETLDGIRNHSWSRPSPQTPEGVVVSWADRIAYVCHDLEDAVSAGIVTYDAIPAIVRERCGNSRRSQLSSFIDAMTMGAERTEMLGMDAPIAEALAALRHFNYENIYLRPESLEQNALVIRLLQQLVDYFIENPHMIVDTSETDSEPGSNIFNAVRYVGGMTDRFAFRQAVEHLGWHNSQLPTFIT